VELLQRFATLVYSQVSANGQQMQGATQHASVPAAAAN
jgi:hypothetical protein